MPQPTLLTILHHESDGEFRFRVVRGDGTPTNPVALPSPYTYAVDGAPNAVLMDELQWYLEEFLNYPYPPVTLRAEHVQNAMRTWGEQVFTTLFSGPARDLYTKAVASGHHLLTLKFVSNDPRVLSWPWERLSDPNTVPLGHASKIVRRLHDVADPGPISPDLPTDRVNILLVIARPDANDIAYRSSARSVVDLIRSEKLPAAVTVLRPPTFAQLRTHLDEHPNYYHLLHFDGHGGYFQDKGDAVKEGRLLFESVDGGHDLVSASQLASLLREYGLPLVLLDACKGATISEGGGSAFASVAGGLIKAGVRGVTAMAYSVYVSATEQFIPAFYQTLFKTGNPAEAVRKGRQQMLAEKSRVCARGTFPLEDWVVPILYEQEVFTLTFAKTGNSAAESKPDLLPDEARDTENPYGFIGRDSAILALERAMLAKPAAILIHGLGGVGKTTLARGFLQWLDETNGLGHGCLWIRFSSEVRTAEYVFNRMLDPFAKSLRVEPALLTMDQKVDVLAKVLRENKFLIVWDNFEAVAGLPEAGVQPAMNEEDRAHLVALVKKLRGGATKILITSRSPETWISQEHRRKIELGGLEGEERWQFCNRILGDLGIKVDRESDAFQKLMDALHGHPLLMRAVLPQLEKPAVRPEHLTQAINNNLASLHGVEEALATVYATLEVIVEGLPSETRELLVPIAYHERFVDADYLEVMTKVAEKVVPRTTIDVLTTTLARAGLLTDHGQNQFELHPALTGYLRGRFVGNVSEAEQSIWARAFVTVFAHLADQLAPKGLHEQRGFIAFHLPNLVSALERNETLDGPYDKRASLLQCLGAVHLNTRNFGAATRYFEKLAEHNRERLKEVGEAGAYHQLGMVALEQRNSDVAEAWYRKSLKINERLGNEPHVAITYHQLGIVEQKRRDFDTAEEWYRKSVEICERIGNEAGAASTYHHLGQVAEERRDFDAAEGWHRKSLEIKERLGNEHGASTSYHELGFVAQERRDFDSAEGWYRKALEIQKRIGDEPGAAGTHHQLGALEHARKDFAAAERWYRQSVEINERIGNEKDVADTYHQLGIVAAERRNVDAAYGWYGKSLAIAERLRDEHGAALTCGQLGILAREREQYVDAAVWFLKALHMFLNSNDDPHIGTVAMDFIAAYRAAPDAVKPQLKALWEAFGSLPNLDELVAQLEAEETPP